MPSFMSHRAFLVPCSQECLQRFDGFHTVDRTDSTKASAGSPDYDSKALAEFWEAEVRRIQDLPGISAWELAKLAARRMPDAASWRRQGGSYFVMAAATDAALGRASVIDGVSCRDFITPEGALDCLG